LTARIAEPQEIARLVVFLCDDRTTNIVGQSINIDGGYLAT
jgi:NAD(P)-dependent dehydrogenase (short-subunit alcohol dehydrogenase family)